MRIGIIKQSYTPYGGAETFLTRFIGELLKRGHTLDVFSERWPAGEGVRVHLIKSLGSRSARPLSFALKAEELVSEIKPDVVISLEMTLCDIYRYGGGCHREWLEIKSKGLLKKLATGASPFHRAMLRLERRVFTDTGLKFVAANSRMVKGDILKHYDLPEEKICVIYNGVDLADFDYPDRGALRRRIRTEMGIADNATVILFIGSGFERKGLATLIRAVGILPDRDRSVRLLVIGRGELSRYAAMARRAGVADKVVFAGPVKGATDYYAAGDIFALPSIYEPFSNACLEAMAASLPVVTTSRNGASEIIEDGVNGGICRNPTDAEELAGKIAPFLDKKKRAEAGRLARAEAEKYPIERNINSFLTLIEKVNGVN